MTKLSITLLAGLFLSGLASAQTQNPMVQTNSLPEAVLETHAMNNVYETTGKVETHYTHDSEKNNSLTRGALVRQGAKVNLVVNADSEISYSRYDYSNEGNTSFYRGVLAK